MTVPKTAPTEAYTPTWDRRADIWPDGACIHELVEAQAERTPDAAAVICQGEQLSYRSLNERANRLAHLLRKRGVGPGRLVAVCLERSLELPIALLGVLKAGGAYLPLDASYPPARLSRMLADAKPLALLTASRSANHLRGIASHLPIVCLDSDWPRIECESASNLDLDIGDTSPAYVMYTSGSTGVPRGVVVPHRGVVNQNTAIAAYFQLAGEDRVGQCTSPSFDISVEEMFPAWMSGASVVLHPPAVVGPGRDFTRWISENGVTVVDLPTAFWHEWVSYLDQGRDVVPASLRLVVVGGQKASSQVLARWRHLAGDRVRWVNGYGPTEATIASIFYSPDDPGESELAAHDDIPIGRPIAGTDAYILDANGDRCAPGVAGELFLGGAGVAHGYLGQSRLTAERFLPDPFHTRPGARMYRTGDRARLKQDGRIEFLGRLDDQVKVRGFRIELGEIEASLRRHPDVHDAVVIAFDVAGGDHDKRLAGYVVGRRASISGGDLREFLSRELPAHMVPATITAVDALPLTASGKVDTARLPVPRLTRESARSEFVAPCGDTEIKLARIWSAVLGVDLVGARDNFFDLGGHSLRATQIASRIRDEFGVELPLAELFERTTIADLARAVEARAADAGRDRPTPAISPAPRTGPLPLSYSQERVWFLQQLEPENLAYNFQTMMFFSGRLDVEALRRSLTHLVGRHEILRTTFADRAGIPEQRIHSAFTVDLPVCDLRDFPLDEREAELTRRVEADLARAFDLRTPPLIRWTLFRTADDEYAMLHVEHHLIHDGWSFNVLRRELLQAYLAYSTGQEPHLPPLPIQFADFAMWQRQWMSGERLQRQLEYWQRRLAGAPSLELPTDHARPPTQTFKGSVLEMELSPELYAALRALSDRMNTTLFVTLEAAFLLLLHRYSGQDDLSIGSGVANRRWTETEGLIGMLVNNVVIRSVLEDEPTFRQFASGVRRTTLEAYEHQDAPFDHVVRVLGRGANRSRNPLFDVMFSFHDAPLDEPVVPDLSFRCAELLSNRSAKFDLNVVAVPHAEQRARIEAEQRPAGITVLWEYNTALFDRATVEQMANHYHVLLSAVVENPDHSVLELELMTAAERRALVAEHNRTRVEYPSDTTVHALFTEQVRRTPDAVALVFDGRHVTYRDLDARSNSVAHRLRDAGVRRGVNVGLCCEKSVEAIVGLLAVLKAGGAFVPMEPRYPDGRLQLIAEDTNIALVLTDARSSARFAGARFPSIDLSTLGATDISRDEPLISAADASDPAYIMFTSGSTGRPKGAVIPHRAIVRLVFGPDFVAFGPERRILHMASLSFDSSTFEIWGALLHGASMIVWSGGPPMPRDLGDAVREHRVDTMWLTASMFNHVIDEAPEALAPLRWLVIGGEALSVPHVRRAQSVLANTTIVNGYGPTESTTFTCCNPIVEQVGASTRSVSIGRPIANTTVYLLDRKLNPVPIGVPGEAYIGGDGLAHGYVGQPALTAERFLPNPFGAPGSRMYRSGDLARYLRDGRIEFLGRADDQIKIRGYRIEPGEIENLLRELPTIRDAAVVARDDGRGGRALVAFVAPSTDASPNATELRAFLRETLPPHMVPATFVVLETLPLTATGKVDRRSLAAVRIETADSDRPIVAATSDLEHLLGAIWREVLNVERLSTDDNFFDLGGHSLLATRIVARIREELMCDLPLRAIFEHPTVASLARRIAGDGATQLEGGSDRFRGRHLFLLKGGSAGTPIFFLPGGSGGDLEFLVYARLVHFAGDGFAFYGLRARSADGVEHAHPTVEQMAADYIAEIRGVQPHGPYRLVGNCIGGVVAYEIARQLRAAGEEIGAVVLMDTDFPTSGEHLRRRWKETRSRWGFRVFRERLTHHLSVLRSVPWRQRFSYVVGRARNTPALLRQAPMLGTPIDPEERVRAGYIETLRRYRPRKYSGPVAIIASNHDDQDPTEGWSDVVEGRITVHRVHGDHESYIRVFVKEAALRLRACLAE